MEPGEARELGFVTVLIPATQAQPGVGREQMRPNKALCVLGAVICASAAQQYKVRNKKLTWMLFSLLFSTKKRILFVFGQIRC